MNSGVQDRDNKMVLYLRIILSAMFIFGSLFSGKILAVILRILCAITSGYSFIFSGVHAFIEGKRISNEFVLSVSVLLLFLLGSSLEGAALFLSYLIGFSLLSFARIKSFETINNSMDYCNKNDSRYISDLLNKKNLISNNQQTIIDSANHILNYFTIFILFFLVFSPLLFHFSYKESIRRSVSIIVVCNTLSIASFADIFTAIGLCVSARNGILFKKPEHFSILSKVKNVIIEKDGVLTEHLAGTLTINTDSIDSDKMLSITAHAVYYSNQSIKNTILPLYQGTIREDLISDFKEIPGIGVGLYLSGNHVVLAKLRYFQDKGLDYPVVYYKNSDLFILTINDQYVGNIQIEQGIDSTKETLTSAFKDYEIEKFGLITNDELSESEELAINFGFDTYYPNSTIDSFNSIVSDFSNKKKSSLLIYSEVKPVNAALCSMSVDISSPSDYVYKEHISDIPSIIGLSKKFRKNEGIYSLSVFIIKALLIMLGMIGIGSAWFAVLIDFVAACTVIIINLRLLN